MNRPLANLDQLDATLEPLLHAARIPGAAIAILSGGEMIMAKGYGYRDLAARLPVTPTTVYPIASTTKAMTATLIGTLVDEGKLDWDMPVQHYLPRFRLQDPLSSTQIKIRDLLSMRSGLPRHDWSWNGYPSSREDLVDRIRHLDLSAGLRERFQYNNILITTAGHISEVVTGRSWEDLVRERLFEPLAMRSTGFELPATGDVTLSYRENKRRELILTRRLSADVTGPSGGSIHSTVVDMGRWALLNLGGGSAAGRRLIEAKTLAQIHFPQMIVGEDPVAITPHAAYAMGWFVDTYNGHARVSHGGYIHDVSSDVALFPADDIGIVSFTNFGCPMPARMLNQYAFDLIMGLTPAQTVKDKLDQYEAKITETDQINEAVRRVDNTAPSHALVDYAGIYAHPGYGTLEIRTDGEELIYQRHRRDSLILPLQHWHYDAWIAKQNDEFPIHLPNPFDPANRLQFETDANGNIAVLSIRLEPAVPPIRFEKKQVA